MKVVKMKLGDIEERRDLNPRGRIRQDKVQEYVRRLLNGETPPPIKVCSRTHIIVDGAQTFHAWREYLGPKWEDHETDVIPIDNMPDPDTESDLWLDRAAEWNRNHGVPLSRFDKRTILSKLAATRGIDAALKRAWVHGETEESTKELLGLLAAPAIALSEAIQETVVSKPAVKETVPLPAPRVGAQRPEACTPGHLRSVTPAVRYHCRALRDALATRKGSLSERDREELEATLAAIEAALGDAAEAV